MINNSRIANWPTKILLPWSPLKKNTFPPEFCNKICTINVWTIKKITILRNNFENVVPFQNGGQITNFYFASFRFWSKFEKNTFPKELFKEIWLKVEEHENIYITEITLKKKIFRFKMPAKTIF